MKNISKYLNNKNGFVFVILIVIILGLGSIGLALAASTVSNLRAHKTMQRLEHDFYDTDGSMTHVQAILERACAYGRYNAQKAADEAYQFGMDSGIPLTNNELFDIYLNSFKYYITSGRGKTYIDEQLIGMKTDSLYKVDASPVWDELAYDNDGIKLRVNLKKLLRNEKLTAVFNMPFNYDLDAQREISIIRDIPVGEATMPIGYYNPIFRSPLTMKSNLILNSNANLYVDARSTRNIALQWSEGLTTGLLYTDARVDIYGDTVPVLERDNTQTLLGNSNQIYVNGFKTDRTINNGNLKRINLTSYYDYRYMSQIITNASDGYNSYFEAINGDCILRVYTGDAVILDSNSGAEWKALSGKRGLVVIAGSLITNSGFNIDSFTGSIVVLGSGSSLMNSSMKIIHNEEAILKAIELYRKTLDRNTFELMFHLDTLMDTTHDPEEVTVTTVTGGALFDSPVVLGNNFVTGSGIQSNEEYPYFKLIDKKIDLTMCTKWLQASMPSVNFVPNSKAGLYKNGTLIWDQRHAGLNSVEGIGDIYSLVEPELLQSWINSGIVAISREKAAKTNFILRIYTGDAYLTNNGKIGDETITGRRGLLFVNGRLYIDGPFNYTGVVIATNGIEAANGGSIEITYDPEVALDALNLTPSAVEFFAKGAKIEQQVVSAYDNVMPSARVSDDALTLFTAAVTISNVKFLPPYTNAAVYGGTSDITLSNSSLNITKGTTGKGLQSTTRDIFVSMGNNTQNSLVSDSVTTSVSGTFTGLNTLWPIADMINLTELKQWLEGSQGPITVSSDGLMLGVYSEGQSFDLSAFNGKKGFIFYNGELNINSDFNFQGVVVATQGISITNGNVNILFDQLSAVDAAALNSTAAKIFLNVPASTVTSGTTYVGAANSGSVNMVNRGVTIVSWNSVR